MYGRPAPLTRVVHPMHMGAECSRPYDTPQGWQATFTANLSFSNVQLEPNSFTSEPVILIAYWTTSSIDPIIGVASGAGSPAGTRITDGSAFLNRPSNCKRRTRPVTSRLMKRSSFAPD